MISPLGGKTPRIAESTFISECASILGDVEIGEHSAAFPGAVVRGDFGAIRIGDYVLIEDNVVVHCESSGLDIGHDVTIGHGAAVNCRRIGDNVLIGMNAAVLHDVEIGNRSIIAAGAVVSEGMRIPEGSLVAGVPAKIIGKASEAQWKWSEWAPELRSWWWELLSKYKSEGL